MDDPSRSTQAQLRDRAAFRTALLTSAIAIATATILGGSHDAAARTTTRTSSTSHASSASASATASSSSPGSSSSSSSSPGASASASSTSRSSGSPVARRSHVPHLGRPRVEPVPPPVLPLPVRPPPAPTLPPLPPPPSPPPAPASDKAVACSCTSPSKCPVIGTLSVPGYKSEPLYCNQLNGAENPGVQSHDTWYYQCVELANRWLTDGVRAPIIDANAQDMCDEADRSAYDVHRRGKAYEPVPGDLLVWSGGRFGHVAVVSAVTPTTITVANQNYGGNGRQYPFLSVSRSPGSFGSPRDGHHLASKCVIHPKKLVPSSSSNVAGVTPAPPVAPSPLTGPSVPPLGSNPCAGVEPRDDGAYCGGSRQSGFAGGDPRTLYTCRRGNVSSVRCAGACTLEASGIPDHCS